MEKGTLLASSYSLGLKATERDAADGASITEDELIDTYQFIMEGTPGQLNDADSAGDINLAVSYTHLRAHETREDRGVGGGG